MVFPVVMCGCESWTINKADCQRIDAFELWCWRRLVRVPWIARRSNQSTLKEISPENSLEGLMLKLKLQYFGHPVWTDSLEKTLMQGKIEGGGEEMTEDEMVGWHHWLNGLEFEHTIWSLWLKLPTPNRHTHWSLDSCPIEIPCGIHCIKICDFYGSAKNQSLITLTRILWINKTNTFAPKDTHIRVSTQSSIQRIKIPIQNDQNTNLPVLGFLTYVCRYVCL